MINNIAVKGYHNEYYDKWVMKALTPKDPKAGRMYGLLKDHKEVKPGSKIPGLRPVVSGSGSNTEQISSFLDYHLKPMVKKLNSYIEGTSDFLRFLES